MASGNKKASSNLLPTAHEPGCPARGDPCADPRTAYMDVFCGCHRFPLSKILAGGTNIAWPAGWTLSQVDEWRRHNGLAKPN
jgi:hypothetical protein